MSDTYDDWTRYSVGEGKEWNKIMKHISDYVLSIADDRESVDVEGAVHGYLPVINIEIATFYKNKSYSSDIQIPLKLLVLIPQNETNHIIDQFIQRFRESFMKIPVVIKKVEPTESPKKPEGRLNNLEV